jgi:hypothetical protein
MKFMLANSDRKLERLRSLALAAMVAGFAVAPCAAIAETAPPYEISPAFREAIANIPGKSITAIVVSYPPGGKSPSHRHARSAFIVGYCQARSAARWTMAPRKCSVRVKAGPKIQAPITASAKTRAQRSPRSCWPFSWLTPTIPS